jgi:septal ring factor EnvC (AmiA/AmiB activator)
VDKLRIFNAAILTFVVYCVTSAPLPVWGAEKPQPSAEAVRRQAEKAVEVRAQTQKLVDDFAGHEIKQKDKIEALENKLKIISRQRQKTETYLAGQKAKVRELNRRLAENSRIKNELEPLLDRSLEWLVQFGDQNPPRLAKETKDRPALLRQKLNDYDLGLAQKTKSLLQVLLQEARYGHTVGVEESEIEIQGRTLRVKLVRLGRLALFAISSDGLKAWRLDPASGQFQPLPDWARELTILAEVAQGKRVMSLVQVPLDQASVEKDQP